MYTELSLRFIVNSVVSSRALTRKSSYGKFSWSKTHYESIKFSQI